MAAVAATLLWTAPSSASANQKSVKSYPVSSGVTYSQYTHSGTNYINHLSVNLGDPYTKLDVGLPAPITKHKQRLPWPIGIQKMVTALSGQSMLPFST